MNNPEVSLRFGEVMGSPEEFDNEAGFSFIYPLRGRDNDPWNDVPTVLNGVGILVPPLGRTDHHILLDADMPFRMKYLRLTALWYNPEHDQGPRFQQYGDATFMSNVLQWEIGSRLTLNLDFVVSQSGNQSIFTYGGPNTHPQINFNGEELAPVQTSAQQGYDNGSGQISVPWLCPAASILRFSFLNREAAKPLYVQGAVFGTKVRI